MSSSLYNWHGNWVFDLPPHKRFDWKVTSSQFRSQSTELLYGDNAISTTVKKCQRRNVATALLCTHTNHPVSLKDVYFAFLQGFWHFLYNSTDTTSYKYEWVDAHNNHFYCIPVVLLGHVKSKRGSVHMNETLKNILPSKLTTYVVFSSS